jgi:glycosyltransferase involved in cell wall biosynthesis
MSKGSPVCFFLAPMKPPDHPVPSGDRTIARNWMRVLADLGWEVRLASRLRSVAREGGEAAYAAHRADGQEEIRRILADGALTDGAGIVFCYHNYYRAPDWIGPELAARLAVPYVVAEPSLAGKRLEGPFREGELQARAGLATAQLIACASRTDLPMLQAVCGPEKPLVVIPAGINAEAWPHALSPERPAAKPVRLLAVAMMRADAKLASYQLLAEVADRLRDENFVLDIHGDGPTRQDVEAAFAPLGARVRFHGQSTPDTLANAYRSADLLVWPGLKEAYGMAFLEAQLHGLPCLAGRFGGVADALAPVSVLVDPCTVQTYADALRGLLRDRAGLASRRGERSLPAMARRFGEAARRAGIMMPRPRAI